nr:hypothetical protein [Micromonospora sp. DSM 115978]
MVDHLRQSPDPDPELAAELRALGRTLHLPTPRPDLASRVRDQLAADRATVERPNVQRPNVDRAGPPRSARQRLKAARPIAAVGLVAAVVFASSSQVRAGVADVLGLGGVTVQVVPSPAAPG